MPIPPVKQSHVFQIVFCKAASTYRIERSWPILGIQSISLYISPESEDARSIAEILAVEGVDSANEECRFRPIDW